jgi:mevalonate kinase
MKWLLPGKTFLWGEYVAMCGGPAMILTTKPCFEVELVPDGHATNLPSGSPAARFWQQTQWDRGLVWHDPWQGMGGLGASSAQYLGAWLAHAWLARDELNAVMMMDEYVHFTKTRGGLAPSGYDVLAQGLSGCVYLNRNRAECWSMPWPFADINFILMHTGRKLATHEHLADALVLEGMDELAAIGYAGVAAMLRADGDAFLAAVEAYGVGLQQRGLVATHTQHMLSHLMAQEGILAAKGCGAMGADVIVVFVPAARCEAMVQIVSNQGHHVLATSSSLHTGNEFLQHDALFTSLVH